MIIERFRTSEFLGSVIAMGSGYMPWLKVWVFHPSTRCGPQLYLLSLTSSHGICAEQFRTPIKYPISEGPLEESSSSQFISYNQDNEPITTLLVNVASVMLPNE
jgi:hypothetical protein